MVTRTCIWGAWLMRWFSVLVIPAQAGIQVFPPLPVGEGRGEGFPLLHLMGARCMDSRLRGNDEFNMKTIAAQAAFSA